MPSPWRFSFCHSLSTELQLDGTPFLLLIATIRKLQSNPLSPGTCGQSEDHASVRTSVKSWGDPTEETCQAQVACGLRGSWWSQVYGRIYPFQNGTNWCPQKILQPLCKVLQIQTPTMKGRQERLLPGSSLGNPVWKFTSLDPSQSLVSLKHGRTQKRARLENSSFVSNLIHFSLQTGSFVTRETSKGEAGH